MDFELKVQGLVEMRKSGSDMELHRAVAMGQLEIVKFLVEKSTATQSRKIRMYMTLMPFTWQQLQEISRYSSILSLKGTATQHFQVKLTCMTPLHLASQQGHLDVVKYLVDEQQMEPLREDEHGNTALHKACAGGCQTVVEFLTSELMQYTPIPELLSDLKNKWNSTPLHSAVAHGHLGILQFFISDQKCDPNILGQHGRTPVHYAAECGRLHIVKYLTDKQGCNPSCLADNMYTPLHIAAEFGNLHIVKYLTDERGCNPSCLDENNYTPLHHAAIKGHIDIDIVKFLTVKKQCDAMCKDFNPSTPLHGAALNGHMEVVKFLTVEMHCDPTSRDENNDTALHLYSSTGRAFRYSPILYLQSDM